MMKCYLIALVTLALAVQLLTSAPAPLARAAPRGWHALFPLGVWQSDCKTVTVTFSPCGKYHEKFHSLDYDGLWFPEASPRAVEVNCHRRDWPDFKDKYILGFDLRDDGTATLYGRWGGPVVWASGMRRVK